MCAKEKYGEKIRKGGSFYAVFQMQRRYYGSACK